VLDDGDERAGCVFAMNFHREPFVYSESDSCVFARSAAETIFP
jgi:hypothetical protein